MATVGEVLTYLCPDSEWVIYDNDFDQIVWLKNPAVITKKQFDDAFAIVDNLKQQAEEEAKAKKKLAESKLAALGLTVEDLKAIGLG